MRYKSKYCFEQLDQYVLISMIYIPLEEQRCKSLNDNGNYKRIHKDVKRLNSYGYNEIDLKLQK